MTRKALTMCLIFKASSRHFKKICKPTAKFWFVNYIYSSLFTCFTVTVTENSGKTTLSSNFVFSELKIGVERRGIPIETRRVEMGCTPAWDPLFSTRKHKINAKCHFSTVFCNVTVKQVNIVLFLIFSGQEVHNSTSLMPLNSACARSQAQGGQSANKAWKLSSFNL